MRTTANILGRGLFGEDIFIYKVLCDKNRLFSLSIVQRFFFFKCRLYSNKGTTRQQESLLETNYKTFNILK